MKRDKGKVSIVGAGPGDPGLITLKALECLKKADVIVYDRLLNEKLLKEAPSQARLIYVGKSAEHHAMEQSEINRLLVDLARQGKKVVRLKGGDPFVFGRGGEEAQSLADQGIAFEIVPAITSAIAVPAYAGIPVTHRGLASSFAVITGHEDPAKTKTSIAWRKLATGADTLVFLMGAGNLSKIVRQLVKNGRPKSTPAALIVKGTSPGQRTITGTLDDIEERAGQENVRPPMIIVVGQVVELRRSLRWFDNRPLFGKRILVTRTREQAGVLNDLLTAQGASVVEMPVIKIEPVSDFRKLDKAVAKILDYSWIIFTSANGVDIFFKRLAAGGRDTRHLKGVKICAIGSATASVLNRHGICPDYVPQKYVAESIVEGFKKREGGDVLAKLRNFRKLRNFARTSPRVLLPRAEMARPLLIEGLAGLGMTVDEIILYKAAVPKEDISAAKQMLLRGEIDVAAFTSSSTVRHAVSLLGDDRQALNKTMIACIGPITAQTAVSLGLKADIIATEYDAAGLAHAIVQKFKSSASG